MGGYRAAQKKASARSTRRESGAAGRPPLDVHWRFVSPRYPITCANSRPSTHPHTHARARAHIHTHTHTQHKLAYIDTNHKLHRHIKHVSALAYTIAY